LSKARTAKRLSKLNRNKLGDVLTAYLLEKGGTQYCVPAGQTLSNL